jgi:hypothetical protein
LAGYILFYYLCIMSIKQIHNSNDGRLVIDLPESMRGMKLVVTVEEAPREQGRAAKNRLMRKAISDSRIQEDVRQVCDDFGHADNELP